MTRAWLVWMISLAVCTAACGDEGRLAGFADGSVSAADAARVDASPLPENTDAEVITNPIDASVADASAADASVVDATPEHDAMVDATVIDAGPPQLACQDLTAIGIGGDPNQLVEITSLVRNENEQNMVGAQVSVINASPPMSTTTAADGSFSLMVPKGATLVLQATMPGHMTGLLVYIVPTDPPPGGVTYHTGMDITTVSNATIDDIYAAAGVTRDPARGMASVFLDLPCTDDFMYADCTGGHTLTLSSPSHPVVFSPTYVPQAGNTTLAGSSPEVVFLNAQAGTATVAYSSTSAWKCESREDAPTPICPNAFTVIRADCDDI